MDTKIKIYTHPEFGKVRTQTDENGDIWFCACDVCNILKHTNTSKAISDFVDESDVTKRYTAFERSGAMLLYVNESGLHSLIMGSKLPAAKQFKHWVTSEVLPSVRKHGAYLTPQAIEERQEEARFLKDADIDRQDTLADVFSRCDNNDGALVVELTHKRHKNYEVEYGIRAGFLLNGTMGRDRFKDMVPPVIYAAHVGSGYMSARFLRMFEDFCGHLQVEWIERKEDKAKTA